MSLPKDRKTPGVYVTEFAAFPPSVVGVQTAVPVFIGYTETTKAANGNSLLFQPMPVTSLAQYEQTFGGTADANALNLYGAISLFYANGGGDCFVVSVGSTDDGTVDAAALTQGLTAAGKQTGPTLVVIPDAVLLPPDAVPAGTAAFPHSAAYQDLVRAMLAQCGTLQDRMALLDPYGMDAIPTAPAAALQAALDTCVANFQADVGGVFLDYGAAYLPLLEVETGVAGQLKRQPASGAMAGLYAFNDQTRGVWNAPANLTVNGITDVALKLTDAQQGPLTVPLDGKAVNVIRDFVNRGSVVWGARTLDGNSPDYRYIQIRRTIIYIEQSIKTALQPFVFAANDGTTWMSVTAMISGFLTALWNEGGLMGDKASDAFTVQCGLGSTMTAQDVLDGYMIVQVTLQMIRPAEFIELTFKQKMEGTS